MGDKKIEMRRQTSTAYDAIEDIINSPVCCGYLKEFCNSQFNVESLQFIMEVDAFQNSLGVDKTSWVDDWRVIDHAIAQEMGVHTIDEVIEKEKESPTFFIWPSRQLNKMTVKADLQALWDSFVEDSAPLEICFPSDVLKRTRYRFDHFERYGPGVFMEATIDPAKTLGKDILPRFEKTERYHQMKKRVEFLDTPVTSDDLVVPPPEYNAEYSQSLIKDDDYRYSLKEIISEPTLYNIFHAYVNSLISAESLHCVRLINIFEAHMAANNMSEAEQTGWNIYKFFVRNGAPSQISLRAKQIRTIAYNLSTPTPLVFADLKKAAMAALTENFNSFKSKHTYQSLPQKYKDELNGGGGRGGASGDGNKKRAKKKGGGGGCCMSADAVVGP